MAEIFWFSFTWGIHSLFGFTKFKLQSTKGSLEKSEFRGEKSKKIVSFYSSPRYYWEQSRALIMGFVIRLNQMFSKAKNGLAIIEL
ncbi:MAG TPA: hypothetical protein DCY95_06815 [Algoriphagus sp.]|nr:hypothetical protein [Algoriphagus sp.]MAN87487.1 hypothetical protein [Algoriphagus sp.]HAD52239.1 hypothetical protein [Algoriphagus sp.]HAS58425.1 hypothetical protein [Algoriphagus sp.]HAZ24379.1 hypothetical protein [Algoriphagus sp.]